MTDFQKMNLYAKVFNAGADTDEGSSVIETAKVGGALAPGDTFAVLPSVRAVLITVSDNIRAVRERAILAVDYDTMARRSELVNYLLNASRGG